MANAEQLNSLQFDTIDSESSKSSNTGVVTTLKIIEYLLLAAVIGTAIVSNIFPELPLIKLYCIASAAVLVFVFFVNLQLTKKASLITQEADLAEKAKLYTNLRTDVHGGVAKFIIPARQRALKYSQDLIDDYKKTRESCRNIYYFFQLATIVLSGVTPILVLVDKLETNGGWLKWLPVICPAIAAIVASIVTSFPFQENWVAANATVELLEAEQEKFILGVTPLYQYSSFEESQLPLETQKAVENFIIQINNIHLKQLQAFNDKKNDQSSEATVESEQA